MFLTALAVELADESKGNSKSREVAGILLRGCLVGRVRKKSSSKFGVLINGEF